ncbi:MAG TPA: sugar transferase [Candidatus Wallbacteria bacterium]|nr:sugar transferase [Candidatus Wallbacteria bacterium]
MINWRKSLYILLDSIFLNAAIIATFYLRYSGAVPRVNYQAYIDISLITTIIGIASLYFNNLYDYDRKNSYVDILYGVTRAVIIGIVIMVAFIFYARSFAFPRTVLIMSVVVNIIFLSAWRFFEKAFVVSELKPLNTLIVGTSSEGILIKNDIETYSKNMHVIAGYLDDTPENGIGVLGGFSDLEKVIEENKIDLVIVSSEKISLSKLIDLIFKCDGANVKVAILPNLYEIVIGRVDIKQIAGIPLLEVNFGAHDKFYAKIKILFDFSLALIGLVLLSPFFLIVPLLIKLGSRGPAVYSQIRVGRFGREFKIYKFRTMVNDAEVKTGPVISSGSSDDRVTPLGRILRKYHIDEFPQLINVLKGDMSMVGPRPERPHFVERFCKMLPVYSKRFLVKPGITGLAQVHGRYDSNFEHKLRYDLAYINNMNLLLDIKIIILTIYSNFIRSPRNSNVS